MNTKSIKLFLLALLLCTPLLGYSQTGSDANGDSNQINPGLLGGGLGTRTDDVHLGSLPTSSAGARWETTDARHLPGEGSDYRLKSTGVKAYHYFEFSSAKFIQGTTRMYKFPMNVTQTVPVPVAGSKAAYISIISVSTEPKLFVQAHGAGDGVGSGFPHLELWGSPLSNPEYSGGNQAGAVTASTPVLLCSTSVGWSHIPIIPVDYGLPNQGIVGSVSPNVVGFPLNVFTSVYPSSLYSASGILYVTTAGQYKIDTTGMNFLRVNTENIWGTTVGCAIRLTE